MLVYTCERCLKEFTQKSQANNFSKILNHPLYKFINNICRYGNFNNIRILQNFQFCDNYNKIYDTFNITPQEQHFIQTNLLQTHLTLN